MILGAHFLLLTFFENYNFIQFLTTFAQLSARPKNVLRGWLLVLGLKEGLVECAAVCIKSVVILIFVLNVIEYKSYGELYKY